MLTDALTAVPGYGRMQGFVFRPGIVASRKSFREAVATAVGDALRDGQRRNAGRRASSSTDAGRKQARRLWHANEVATPLPWRSPAARGLGIAIDTVASQCRLGFIPMQEEQCTSSCRPNDSAPRS
jgi:putative molybdopterin biosynthesis protein